MANKQLKAKRTAESPKLGTTNSGYIPVGSAREQSYLRQLQIDMRQVDVDYVNYVKKQASYSTNRAELKRRFSGMNGIFFNQMLLTCVSPLQDGISMDSVMQCLAMYMGMRTFSKDFRNRIDNMGQQARYDKLMKTVNKYGPDSKRGQAAQQEAASLKRNLTMYNNGGREPLTAHSAALMKIGMSERAYTDMRQPGADVEKIKQMYTEAMSALDDECAADGISASDVNKKMRTIVGQWSEKNPTHADLYSELSYDGVGRAPFHKNPNNPNQQIWTGEYMDFDGKMFNGAFTPREPLTVESAARIKLDMTTQAYENMRKEGADIDAFFTQYTELMDTLSRLCEADGISEDAVNKQMWLNIGQEIQKDPSFANMFRELSYDGIEKAPPHRNPSNPNQAIWTGEYVNKDGQLFSGQFTPRAPLTQDYAALLKIEMTLDAYTDMREPGADIDDVMRKYRGNMAGLSKQCAVDGINEHDVNQQVRIMVGEYCEQEPGIVTMFKEISDDGVTKASSHIDATNQGTMVWTGEYKMADGKPFTKAFTPRPPRSYDAHMDELKKNMNQQFKQVKTADDLYCVLRNYVNANAVVFGNMPVADVDKNNPAYQDVRTGMQLMHDDCVYDDNLIAELKERIGESTDVDVRSRLASKITAYEASNDAFNQRFDVQFSKLLTAAQGRVSPSVMNEFKAVYGEPNNVINTLQMANQQRNDDCESTSKWRIYDAHLNAFEKNANREFAHVKTADDLRSLFTGYVAGYESVCRGKPVTRTNMVNSTYQTVSHRMQFMMADCGMDADVIQDFGTQFVDVLNSAQKRVPSDIMQEFIHKYDDPKAFVAAEHAAYDKCKPLDVDDVRIHPERGCENDMPHEDLSSKGRGIDAERRLNVDGQANFDNPNKDYQV